MNEIQHDRNVLVDHAKARVQQAEAELREAEIELAYHRAQLTTAIDADPESWHATPGILK